MNTDQIVTSGSISSKIIGYFIFVMVEVICNTIAFFVNLKQDNIAQDGSLNQPNMMLQ